MNSIESLTSGHKLIRLLGAIALFVLYMLPTMIAIKRKCKRTVPIVIVNAVTGVTGLGWLIALLWSFTGDVDDSPRMKNFSAMFFWILGPAFYVVSTLACTEAVLAFMPYDNTSLGNARWALVAAVIAGLAGYGVRRLARRLG